MVVRIHGRSPAVTRQVCYMTNDDTIPAAIDEAKVDAATPATEETTSEVAVVATDAVATPVEPEILGAAPAAPPVPALPPQPVPVVPRAPQSQDLSRIAQDLQIRKVQVEAVVQLLDSGNTVPFITRYRKEQTGGLNEDGIRLIQGRIDSIRQLTDRKQTVLKSIAGQGRLTDDLTQAILEADHPKRLEDLYLPYKPKKRTLASDAREKGLEPLALAIWTRDSAVDKLDEVLPGMVDPWKQLHDVNDVLTGVKHILAELVSENSNVRGPLRAYMWDTAILVSTKIETVPEGKGIEYREYYEFKEPVRSIPPHRVLAVNRGEKEQILRLRVSVDVPRAKLIAEDNLPLADHPNQKILIEVATDAVDRLILPSLEREIRRDLTDRAQDHAIHVFARNLRGLFLQPPLRGKRVLAIDPGMRSGCKVAVLDETGVLLEDAVIYPHQPQKRSDEAKRKLEQLIRKHGTSVIAIGNGTACRETEQLISDLIAELEDARINPKPKLTAVAPLTVEPTAVVPPESAMPAAPLATVSTTAAESVEMSTNVGVAETVLSIVSMPGETSVMSADAMPTAESVTTTDTAKPAAKTPPPPPLVISLEGLPDAPTDLAYVIVNEAGASDYSASPISKEEFPTLDATTRGTVSIGRRLQDPLAELVKIDPQHVGVGLYQHDLRPKHLKASLEGVVESCVNHVGVDVNTASVPLLRHVSGLNQLAARELVEYRKANGPFKTREQLKSVPQLGEARFTQAAGFLKVIGGEDPLDVTWIHPESYPVARQYLTDIGFSPVDLLDKTKIAQICEKLNEANPEDVARKLNVGVPTVLDIFEAIARPGLDPREELPPPVFKKGILKIEDVTMGMELTGTVLNVVPFGAFVDIGVKESGLVHISQMANRYIKSPYDVVSVGDVVHVWVMEVKAGDKKISLSMIPPGSERKPMGRQEQFEPRQERPPQQSRPQAPRQERQEQRPPQQGQGQGPPQGDRRGPGGPPQGGRQVPPGDGGRRFPAPRQGGQPPRPAFPANAGSRNIPQPTVQAAPLPPRKPAKPRAPVKLTDEKKAGKAALNTFAELSAFFTNRTEPDVKPTDATPAPESNAADGAAASSDTPPTNM